LGSGADDSVRALAIHDGDGAGPAPPVLWVGGSFTSAGGNTVMRLATWDGDQWGVPLNGGADAHVFTLLATDAVAPNSLYVGGAFQWAGGVLANRVARWDGAAWSALGSGTSGEVRALYPYDPDGAGPQQQVLLAGGLFATAGSVQAANIAMWDGTAWSGLGNGTNGVVRDFEVFDEDGAGPAPAKLFACGLFTQANSTPANRVIRLDGTQWTQVGTGLITEVYALHVFDYDGPGIGSNPPSLYAGGLFNSPLPQYVARWDGKSWSSLGAGMDAPVFNFATFAENPGGAPGLYMVGSFMSAGGLASGRIARWGCEAPPCYPDCDFDGLLTLADFGCFQTKFGLGDLYADCDGDGMLTLADFGCFQTASGLGCP
jgi:trimeric autotransporter adhesin